MQKIIENLTVEEIEWWKKAIKWSRKADVKPPLHYVEKSVEENLISLKDFSSNPNQTIRSVRSTAWEHYINDEITFHRNIIKLLLSESDKAKDILKSSIKETGVKDLKDQEIAKLIGDYSGRIMPFIYQLSLSTTNSRRSRAGKTLEWIIKKIMDAKEIPYQDQKALGKSFYRRNGLGKIVDLIIPSGEVFENNRRFAMIVTMKTSLRERWAEVVEEIQRTNIPNIHLVTLESQISVNLLQLLDNYNITLVVYDEVKKKDLRSNNNVIGFTDFFSTEIKHHLSRK